MNNELKGLIHPHPGAPSPATRALPPEGLSGPLQAVNDQGEPELPPDTSLLRSSTEDIPSPSGTASGRGWASAEVAVTPLIDLAGVTKTYRTGDLAVEVLHGIDLRIYPGEFVAIVGQSGSGKSTLMNILGCLDRPTTGTYRFLGEDVSGFGRDELARLRRIAFGFVFQSYNLIAGASATQNVEVPAIYAGMSPADRHERAEALLTTLGLAERLDHKPNQLSGGQQQRVSIARALMNGGQIILADEPTGALDSKSGVEVLALLDKLSRAGHTVIVITHSQDVAAHAHRVVEIRDGIIVSDPGPGVHANELSAFEPRDDSPGSAWAGLVESAKAAGRALRSNLFRTALTLLGIVIGVGSVIAMLAVGDGAKQAVVDRISGMGTNLLLIRPAAATRGGMGSNTATMTPDDAEAMAALPNVLAAVPELGGNVTTRFGNADYQTQATSTSAEFTVARNWPVSRGAFFSREDVRSYAPVVVLGQTVVKNLFTDGADPVGKHIVLNNVMFQVIGIMSERGASPNGADQDDVVVVPYTTGGLRLFGQRFLRNITVAVDDVSRIDETQAAVETLLEARHRTVDFQIRNMASLLETATETQNTLTMLLGSIAAISLLVGGIGVMNIMLVNVTERTREIGVRMATGARMRDIMQQFLTEALAVSALGGLIGVAGGLSVAALIGALGTPVKFSVFPVALAFGCAFATGLIFGYMPARKAAGLDPVVALASE
jgi:macrolide transport system ATP-binding/permease protein